MIVKATPISTMKSTLTKEIKKGIEVTPVLANAARKVIESGRESLVRADGEWFLLSPVRPVAESSPTHGKFEFEDVYIMLITGYASYGIPKGGLDEIVNLRQQELDEQGGQSG